MGVAADGLRRRDAGDPATRSTRPMASGWIASLRRCGALLRRPGGPRASSAPRAILTALLLAPLPWGHAQPLSPELAELARAGIAARQQGDLEAAERALASLARQAPEFLPAHLNLGLVQYERFDYVNAARTFGTAITLDPDVEGVPGLLGHALLEAGRISEAAGMLQKAVDRKPGDHQARFRLALALVRLDRIAEAEAQIALLRREAGDDPEILRLRILTSGARSAELRRELMQSAPGSVAAKITAAETLTAAKEWGEAQRAYETVLRTEPHRRGIRLALGDLLFAQGYHGRAEALFRDEEELAPYSVEPLVRLGHLLLFRGDSAGAEGVMQRALELESGNPEALELLARSLADQDRHGAALEPLLRAASEATDPDLRIRVQYQLSRAYRRLGDRNAADRHAAEFRKLQAGRRHEGAEKP